MPLQISRRMGRNAYTYEHIEPSRVSLPDRRTSRLRVSALVSLVSLQESLNPVNRSGKTLCRNRPDRIPDRGDTRRVTSPKGVSLESRQRCWMSSPRGAGNGTGDRPGRGKQSPVKDLLSGCRFREGSQEGRALGVVVALLGLTGLPAFPGSCVGGGGISEPCVRLHEPGALTRPPGNRIAGSPSGSGDPAGPEAGSLI